jgi:ketosteroid isomerase-like protein
MRRSPLLGFCLFAVACAPKSDAPVTAGPPAPLSAEELEAVKAVDAAFAAGMNAKDTAAVFAVYADDAKVMPQDSPTLDLASAKPIIAGLIAGGATNFALTSTIAYGVGDLAYMVGTATFTMGGATETVKYVEVLRKGADGKWRYVVDAFSNVAPPPAKP